MGYSLYGVLKAVSPVVHWIDAPLVALPRMLCTHYSVHYRIPQVQVSRCHVYLGPEGLGTVGELAVLHSFEEVQVFFYSAVPVWTLLAWLGEGAPVFPDLVGRKVVHIGFSCLDKLYCQLIHLGEIVGGIAGFAAPVEAQPLYIGLDGVDIFGLLFCRVGVVETEVCSAAVLLCNAEVKAHGLCMSDMKIAVRLRREPSDYRSPVFAVLYIFFYDFLDKIL